jgi:AAA domain
VALKTVDLHAPLEPIRFVVPDLFPAGFVSFVGAREGVGKTTILTGLLWQMTRPKGGAFLGFRVPHGPSIYVNTDAPDGDSRSVRHWLEKHRAAYPDGNMHSVKVFEPGDGGLTPNDLLEIAAAALEIGAVMIVLDSYMGAFPGLNGNKLEMMMKPMSGLRDLAARTGAAVIVTDHIPKRAPGEKDGDRGIMGSVAKSAQARAVHIVTRVDPKDCAGQNLMRWEVHKQSFAQRLEPFGVSIIVEGDDLNPARLVHLERADLPGDASGSDRAKRAVTRFLEARAGEWLPRRELLEVAVTGGNLRERMAEDALRRALGAFGDRLKSERGKAKGAPMRYRLEALPSPEGQGDSSDADLAQALAFEANPIAPNDSLSDTHSRHLTQSQSRVAPNASSDMPRAIASNALGAVQHETGLDAIVSEPSPGAHLTPALETKFLRMKTQLGQADRVSLPTLIEAAREGKPYALERLFELEAKATRAVVKT